MTPKMSNDWNAAKPATLPEPTYWPVALALGNLLALWGLVTTWIISAVGMVLVVASLSGWIRNLTQEHRQEDPP